METNEDEMKKAKKRKKKLLGIKKIKTIIKIRIY